MRRILSLTAVCGALLAGGNAHAVFLSIDDFNTPDLQLADTTPNGVAVSVNQGVRTVSHNLFSPAPNPSDPTFSVVRIGNATFPTGLLQVTNGDHIDSQVRVSWTLGSGFVPGTGGASFQFLLNSSDANPLNINLSFGTMSLGSVNIPGNTSGAPILFAISAANQLALSAGGLLTMTIDGTPGWDMSLDSFGINIPSTVSEPASWALVGMALLGAGLASRRRRG